LFWSQKIDDNRFFIYLNGEAVANPEVEKQATCKKIGPGEVVGAENAVNLESDVVEAEVMMFSIIIM
jgi:hypothetical protein